MTGQDRDRSSPRGGSDRNARLDEVVAKARRAADERARGYREQSLRLHPWVCARCGREFTSANLQELTVHHKDHNHDNNPPDGSNWENLCLYCHDWEHQKFSQLVKGDGYTLPGREKPQATATHNPFVGLKEALENKK